MVYTRKTEDVFDLLCMTMGMEMGWNEFVLAPHIRKLWRIAKLILRMKEFAQRL